MLPCVATLTTPSTAALILGPPWWGNRWLMRDGTHAPLTDTAAREHRKTAAESEAAGLHAALDALPADCVLLLAGASKAVHLAHTWADRRNRQVLVVPNIDPPTYWPLVKATTLGLQGQGWKVKALACSAGDPDAVVGELREAGLFVRVVEPQVSVDSPPVPVE